MKKIKLFFLAFMIIFITGCSVDYDLVITSNHRIKENVKTYIENDILPETKKGRKDYFKNQIASYSSVGGYRNYKFSYKIGDELSYIQLDTWHPSFESYEKSIIYNNLFEKIHVMSNSEYTTFETVGKYFYSDLYGDTEMPDPDFYMGDINVKIRLHNEILESNADNVDEKNNTLEWTLSSKDEVKSINFKISHKKRYDIILMDMYLLNKKVIITTSLIAIIVAIIGYSFYNRFQRNNSI